MSLGGRRGGQPTWPWPLRPRTASSCSPQAAAVVCALSWVVSLTDATSASQWQATVGSHSRGDPVWEPPIVSRCGCGPGPDPKEQKQEKSAEEVLKEAKEVSRLSTEIRKAELQLKLWKRKYELAEEYHLKQEKSIDAAVSASEKMAKLSTSHRQKDELYYRQRMCALVTDAFVHKETDKKIFFNELCMGRHNLTFVQEAPEEDADSLVNSTSSFIYDARILIEPIGQPGFVNTKPESQLVREHEEHEEARRLKLGNAKKDLFRLGRLLAKRKQTGRAPLAENSPSSAMPRTEVQANAAENVDRSDDADFSANAEAAERALARVYDAKSRGQLGKHVLADLGESRVAVQNDAEEVALCDCGPSSRAALLSRARSLQSGGPETSKTLPLKNKLRTLEKDLATLKDKYMKDPIAWAKSRQKAKDKELAVSKTVSDNFSSKWKDQEKAAKTATEDICKLVQGGADMDKVYKRCKE